MTGRNPDPPWADIRRRAAEAIQQSGELAEQHARRAAETGAEERAELERAYAARARELLARISGGSGASEGAGADDHGTLRTGL
jgi:hypothetical protein